MKKYLKIVTATAITGLVFTNSGLQQIFAQSGYDESLLNLKRSFSTSGAAALSQPFEGVTTPDGRIDGLFPISATGVTTAPVKAAADEFLASLTPAQQSRVHFAVDDPEWRNWSNVDIGIFSRQGLSLEEMSASQKTAAFELMTASLSAKGLQLAQDIMKTEQTLLEINADPIRYGEDKYYFTMMGIPSADQPWGWQLDGHHLVINYFVLADQVVMTPVFWGGEPVITTTGKYSGNTILQDEQDAGLAFMQSLSKEQQDLATINREKTRNNSVAAANEDNLVLAYQGLPGSQLTASQREDLLRLVNLYVGNMDEGHAKVRLDQVAEHLDETWFSWIGGSSEEAVFYYRIHSPVILIEFDHQNPVGYSEGLTPGEPSRQHIHSVVRTPNGNDYGKDLLRQHLESVPH